MRKKESGKKPELLAPAGDLERLKFAIVYGADAVYIGGRSYSLRSGARNFTFGEMKEGVNFSHKHGKKVYVACNIFALEDDLKGLFNYLDKLTSLKIDGVIVSDYGVFRLIRSKFPTLPIHISTQANITNSQGVKFLQELGAKRVTLARELSFSQLKKIICHADIEIEVFVHGAMCISYSGRCFLSKYLAQRDANLGDCAHSCRWKYCLIEERGENEKYPVYEDKRGTYIFNSKDLCLIKYVPELISAGVDSFKLEGRTKSVYYVAAVTSAYRKAIDAFFEDDYGSRLRELEKDLRKVSHRDYTTGFMFDEDKRKEKIASDSYTRLYKIVGVVGGCNSQENSIKIKVKNPFLTGESLEVLKPDGEVDVFRVREILDEEGKPLKEAQPNMNVAINCRLPEYSILRKREEDGC